jgi:hypothetical protein
MKGKEEPRSQKPEVGFGDSRAGLDSPWLGTHRRPGQLRLELRTGVDFRRASDFWLPPSPARRSL